MINLEQIQPIIEDIIKQSLRDKVYQYGIKSKGLTSRVATGNLANSIKSQIKRTKEGVITLQIMAFGQPLSNTYAYWLINDRQPGRFPNIKAIEQWIMNKKSFRIRDLKTGRYLEKNEKNVKTAAFLVSRSMSKFGFKNKPHNFIEISYEKIINNTQIKEIIGQATIDDLLQILEGI
jgi:hypothetical protein